MMQTDSQQDDNKKLRRSIKYTLAFVVLIWSVKIIELISGLDFGNFGILPRTVHGSIGIFLAPLIHGDFYHLISNSLPIFLLGVGLFYFYEAIATYVVILIYLMTGFWVWMAARDAYHIGASGLVYGLLTFLLFSGFFRKDKRTLSLSFIILVLYGGSFISGLFPTASGVSWESHLMGAIAGVFCAVYFKSTRLKYAKEAEDIGKINSYYSYHYKELPKKKQVSYYYTISHNNKNESEQSS